MYLCLAFPRSVAPCSYSVLFQGTSWKQETRRTSLMQTISLSGTEELPSRSQGASSIRSHSAQVGALVGGWLCPFGPAGLSIACRGWGSILEAKGSQRQPGEPVLNICLSWTSDQLRKCCYPKCKEIFTWPDSAKHIPGSRTVILYHIEFAYKLLSRFFFF